MIAELHCHTSEHSACSHVNAVKLVTRAYEAGLQAIIITDHHYQWNDEDLAEVKRQAGLPDIFHILAGQEFKTSDYGDVLIYGLKETIKKGPVPLADIRDKYPEAAIIWAHPYRHGHHPEKEKLLNPLFNGIEIFSSNYNVNEAALALKDWHEYKFTAIAGTDTHALSYTGSYPTLFDHPFSSIEGMVEEMKAGRCRPYFKEIKRSGTTDTEVTELIIGPKSSRKKMIIKQYQTPEAWEEGERSFHIAEEIYNNGFADGKYRISRPLEKDEKNLSLIEEHVSGSLLYDLILNADASEAKKYLQMAAGWLAELHNMQLNITSAAEYLSIERERLEYYLSGMYKENHPYVKRTQQILDEIWKNEQAIIKNYPDILVQGHGDYHLKNIFAGKDKENGEDFIAAIDFNSSYFMPQAFDVGTFISQYRNMYFDKPEILYKAPVEIFFNEYLSKADILTDDFQAQVQLYKARAYLSIIYYLVKVGKGESENFWTILVDAERSLAHMSYLRSFR